MTKVNQKVWAVLLAALMLVSVFAGFSLVSVSNTASAASKTPVEETLVVKKAKDGNWYTFNKKTNKINNKYTGVAKNQYGWWRIVNGKVNFKANGVFKNSYGSWWVENGKVNFDKNQTVTVGKTKYVIRGGKATLYKDYKWKTYNCNDLKVIQAADGNWYAFYGNDIAWDYYGIAPNNNGWWRIEEGRVNFNAKGVYSNDNGSYYVENGKVNFAYYGIYKATKKTYTIVAGKVVNSAQNSYNGAYDSKKLTVKKNTSDGNWYAYTEKGKIASDYTGIAGNEYGWWRIVNGRVDFTANGVFSNEYGIWYVENGKVNFGFEGPAADALGTAYYFISGKAV